MFLTDTVYFFNNFMKRKELTDEDRCELLDLLNKHSTTKVSEITGRPPSTISSIKGESEKILSRISQVNFGSLYKIKRHRTLKHQDLDLSLFEWFSEKRKDSNKWSHSFITSK